MIIQERTIGQAWRTCCQEVMSKGSSEKDSETNIKELMNIIVKISNPFDNDAKIASYMNQEIISWMRKNFFQKKPIKEWGYSYGQRLYDYNGINQIESVIKKLKSKRETKAATITTIIPSQDSKHAPCICLLDFKIRNDKMQTTAIFRSQDIGKKMCADALCLAEIMKHVASSVGVQAGNLILHIISAHIYESDFDQIKNLLRDNL